MSNKTYLAHVLDIAQLKVQYDSEAKKIVAGDLQKRETLTNHRYDLLTVVMIGLDKKSFEEKQTKLHGLLGTVFSEQLKPDQKIEILYKDYGMKTVKAREEGVVTMCNLSDAIEERGIKKGLEESAIKAIYDAVLSLAPNYDKDKVYALLHAEE